MNAAELRDFCAKHLTRENQIVLNHDLLPEAGLLAGYLNVPQIILDGAASDESTPVSLIKGKITLYGLQQVDVQLLGGGDEHSTWLQLRLSGIPNTWNLSSLGTLPSYWASEPEEFGYSLQESFFHQLQTQGTVMTLSTQDLPDGGILAGINVEGYLHLDAKFAGGLAGDLLRWFKTDTPLAYKGTVRIHSNLLPLEIDLQAELDHSVAFEISSLHLSKMFLWLHTVTPPETLEPVSRMELAARMLIGSPVPMEMTVSTELVAGAGSFVFRGFSENRSFSLGNGLTDIASIFGVKPDSITMPKGLSALSKLYLREICLGLSAVDKSPQYISISLDLPAEPPWKTPIPKLSIKELHTGWTYEFGTEGEISGYVGGTVGLGEENPVQLDVEAIFPDFEIIGRLEDETPISLTKLITSYVDVPDLPNIDVSELWLTAAPAEGQVSISGTVTDDWTFSIGKLAKFAITEVYFSLNYAKGSGFSGTVGGMATLGTAAFSSSYAFPGNNFVIEGRIPSLSLGELLSELCKDSPKLPAPLNLTLTNSDLAITKNGSDYTLFLQSGVNGMGTLFFTLLYTSQKVWGAAVGVDLSAVRKLGDLPGFEFMNAIDLTMERMILVLSSVDLPNGFVFPDLSTYTNTAIPSKNKVAIPSGIGAPKHGINFYASFAFGDRSATEHKPLLKLYDFFSIKRVELDVALRVSEQDDALSILLMAGVSISGEENSIKGGSETHHMNLSAYLAIQYSEGTASIFLRGLLVIPAPHVEKENLTFAMELGVQENGFYVAGSMTGSWTDAFDITGLTVSDLALEVGADWEGIPMVGFAGTVTMDTFNGSVACIMNSENPVQSVLAGSLSDLCLGDILHTFVGPVSSSNPLVQAMQEVLDEIKIDGVNEFTLPLIIVPALDSKDLGAVAQAFIKYGLGAVLAPDAASTLLIIGKPGKAWFITDKTAGVKHYEIKLEGDHLTVKLEAQLYVCPVDVNIAALSFKQGNQVFGKLNLFGYTVLTEVVISQSQGFFIEERMDTLELFGGLFRLSKATGDTRGQEGNSNAAGPYLSVSTFTQPSKPEPYREPHFYVSGALSFLGLLDMEMNIAVTKAGLHVQVKRNLFGTVFDFTMDVTTQPLSISGGGTAGLVLDLNIDLSRYGLGSYSAANTDLTASLAFGLSGEQLTGTAEGNVYLDIPEFGIRLGPYHVTIDLIQVDQPLSKLKDLFESEFHRMQPIASDLSKLLLSDAKHFVKLVQAGYIRLEDTLDHVLMQVFKVSLADITAVTSCFAEDRLAPHVLLTAAPPELPQSQSQGDSLNQLRQLRTDLGSSPMGLWIVNIYNTLSQPLVDLYDHVPTDPNDPSFKKVLDLYNGSSIYHKLTQLLSTTGTTNPLTFNSDFATNSLYLISEILNIAQTYAVSGGTGDTKQSRNAALIQKGITALLQQQNVILKAATEGMSYQQLLAAIAAMTPPVNPFES